MTRFFEPINVSAPHIYHSALELSPLSSIIRKSYDHERLTPFPRVEIGIPDSQDLSISIPSVCQEAATWSPCGQFMAAREGGIVKIRNALTFELVSTLQPPRKCTCIKASPLYTPDGRSLASITSTGVVIWDIQTGGVIKNIQCTTSLFTLLAWSLDGGTIGVQSGLEVRVYSIASNMESDPLRFGNGCAMFLWAQNEFFQSMKHYWDGKTHAIEIYEARSRLIPTKVEEFSVLGLEGEGHQIVESFSPTTYRISGRVKRKTAQLFILDMRNSAKLLVEKGESQSHSFSSGGSYFGAFQSTNIHVWNYDGSIYIPWRQFQCTATWGNITFSPTLSSMVVCYPGTLRLWHLNHPLTAPTTCIPQLEISSRSGTHIATAHYQESTVKITYLSPQTPSQSIDTGIKIMGFGLTGNVFLVKGTGKVVAWLLTEEGQVNTVSSDKGVSQSDSIWTMSLPSHSKPKFSVQGETGVIDSGKSLWVYNAKTGQVFEPTEEPPDFHGPWYSFKDNLQAKGHDSCSSLQNVLSEINQKPTQTNLTEGWMKDQQGKYLLWLPTEWRVGKGQVEWFPDISTMKFKSKFGKPTIIKLQ